MKLRSRKLWLSCSSFTILVTVDAVGTIIEPCPETIRERFCGLPVGWLIEWMQSIGDFRKLPLHNIQNSSIWLLDEKSYGTGVLPVQG